jgi:hypothetical protein
VRTLLASLINQNVSPLVVLITKIKYGAFSKCRDIAIDIGPMERTDMKSRRIQNKKDRKKQKRNV